MGRLPVLCGVQGWLLPNLMAVIGDGLATLTPFGVGGTIEHLATGGHPHPLSQGPPRRLDGRTMRSSAGFSAGGGSGRSSPPLSRSSSVPSWGDLDQTSSTPKMARTWSTASARQWTWDDLQSVRSNTREREAGRIARFLGKSVLSKVSNDVPLAVTQNAYYRRTGLVHGDHRFGERVIR